MRTLADLKPGDVATVKRLHGRGPLKRRLNDMGVTKGTEITITKVAPLGDPMQILVKSYDLTVRRGDASEVEVF